MSMNIKNPEAHRLAQEVARLTGESITDAVIAALRERLGRLIPEQSDSVEDRIYAINEIVVQMAPYAHLIPSSDQVDELLYDDLGLPK